ncbi:MAG: alpha/beta hydrolase [Motilibacteraceae bacterium]
MSDVGDWPAPVGPVAGLAVLLPGKNYPSTMPLLTFAGRAARQHGWQVRAVSWTAPELHGPDAIAWVGEQLRQAVGPHDGPVLVVGKSLGTCAAALAADRGYEAVWLTPLLHLPLVVDAMARHRGRQLLVGGSADPTWDLERARAVSADVVELEGADHAMFVDDAVRTAELHLEVTRAVDEWLTAAPRSAAST